MRYLKLSFSCLALFLMYMWMVVLFNSCKGSTAADQTGEQTEQIDDLEEIDLSDDEDDFESGSDDVDVIEADPDPEEDDSDYEAGDYTSAPEQQKVETKPKSKPVVTQTPRKSTTSTTSSNGSYMVIAGSYLLEENARKMVNRLKRKGYSNAEIVYFNNSQYHSICAGRYNTRSSAKQTANRLISSGIDSYVHRKQR